MGPIEIICDTWTGYFLASSWPDTGLQTYKQGMPIAKIGFMAEAFENVRQTVQQHDNLTN